MNYKEIKSYEDACKVLGLKPLADEVFNAFPKAEREDVKAYHQLSVITKAINEGWEPDWTNRKEEKFEPYMYTNTAGLASAPTHSVPLACGCGSSAALIGSRLCFPDYERAAYAVATFGELYKAYFRPGKWESSAEQEAATEAAGKEPENMEQDGGDTSEEDMSDAPEFLQKVVAVCKQHIEPLCAEKDKNKGFIVIAVEDGVEDEEGESCLCTTAAVLGRKATLAKGFARFLQAERSQEIVKGALLRIKFDRLMKEGVKAFKDILDILK